MSKILTMKLYFDTINMPNLCQVKHTEKESIWFLSYFGKYKILQNKIFLYKLSENTEEKIQNFVNNKACYVFNEKWNKAKEIYYLPKDCIPIKIKKKIYHIDSKLSFVIEEVDNKRNDCYFETLYDLDDFCLKNELISFLQT